MARKKSKPIVAHDPPKSLKVIPAADSMPTPSGSFSSTSTHPTCPHCRTVFPDMSITDFRDHVAGCTRPSTAEEGTSSSSLSSPPPSASQLTSGSSPAIAPLEAAPEVVQEVARAPTEPVIADKEEPTAEIAKKVDEDPIRPYLDPTTEFDFYDQAEAVEEPEAEIKDPDFTENLEDDDLETAGEPFKKTENPESPSDPVEGLETTDVSESPPKIRLAKKPGARRSGPSLKFSFATFTPVETFEAYLKENEDLSYDDLSYDELYHRTAKVSGILAAYQTEWDNIEKEILVHENLIKVEAKRVEDEAKEIAEAQRLLDGVAREKVFEKYKQQLKLGTREFSIFLEDFEENNPSDSDTVKHLHNLRNPQFMAAINKKKRVVKNKEENLENAPYPEIKLTKEEIAIEKRKRGRLMDPSKFDDMKMADAYGFEYSAHVKHIGAQPFFDNPRRSQTKGQTKQTNGDVGAFAGIETGESRGRRNRVNKRVYEAEHSVTPETEEDRLPTKRVRKAKILDDGIDTNDYSQRSPFSRSGTPKVNAKASKGFFPSGKRIGRPPSKIQPSNLQVVQTASTSDSSQPPAGSISIDANGSISRDLGPFAEAQLHNAAESLVNQTVTDNAEAAPLVKKKHAGGRPRKHPIPDQSGPRPVPPPGPSGGTLIPDLAINKPRNKGGRPRKIRADDSTIKLETAPQDDIDLLQSTEQDDGSQEPITTDGGRPKRKRTTTDTDTSPIIVDDSHLYAADPPSKKRRSRIYQDDPEEIETMNMLEGKSKPRRDTTLSRGSTAPTLADGKPNPKKRKARNVEPDSDSDSDEEEEEEKDNVDTSNMTPEEFAAYEVERKRKKKSRKLSRSMKRRWRNGGMKEAQETRRLNNARKKAEKEAAQAAAEASGVPYLPPLLTNTPTPTTTLKTPTITPKLTASRTKVKQESFPRRRSKPPPPPPRQASTRTRKPTRAVRTTDGAFDDDDDDEDDEDDDEIEKQFASEYDHFQALTSPKGNVVLGKRVRKSLVDLSQVQFDTEDDDSEQDDFDDERYD